MGNERLLAGVTARAIGAVFLLLWGGLGFGQELPAGSPTLELSKRAIETSRVTVYLPTGDDTAIRAAISGLPAEGGIIVLGPALFPVSKPIVIDRDGVELRGTTSDTILRLTDHANCSVIVIGSTETPIPKIVRNVIVRNLVIDGNRGAQEFECCGGPCDGGGLSFIRNNGITVRGTEDILIENVETHNNRSGGVVLEKYCRRVHVSNLESYNNEFDGLAAYETEDCTFTQMKLHHNRSAAMSVDWKFNRNLITDSQFTENGSQGIFMRDSADNQFERLTIRDNGEQGMFIAETREIANSASVRNRFNHLIVTGNRTQGIRVNDPSCVDNVITNSRVSGNKAENISLAAEGLLVDTETIGN